MSRRFVAAVAAGSFSMMVAGYLLYGVLFAWLFREGALTIPGVMKQSPEIPWIIAGQIGFGVLVTLVVSWRGAHSFSSGASTGAIVGLLMAIGYDFAQYGTSNLWTLQATLFDPFITAALVGVGGGTIGFVLGLGKGKRDGSE